MKKYQVTHFWVSGYLNFSVYWVRKENMTESGDKTFQNSNIPWNWTDSEVVLIWMDWAEIYF